MDWLIGKSKKKEKESNEFLGQIKNKIPLYLEPNNCTTAFLSVVELKELTMIPPGLNSREWIALQTYYVFENLNLLFEVISVYCTQVSCPIMVGTGNMIYHWFDEKGKKIKLSAPQFIDHVMTNIQKIILDESIFPTKYGNQFPSNFESQITKIIKWLFQVMSHLYHAHYGHIISLFGLNSHLNSLFVHLIALSSQIDRLDKQMNQCPDLNNLTNITDVITSTANATTSEPFNINENTALSSQNVNNLPNSFSLNSMASVSLPNNNIPTSREPININNNNMYSNINSTSIPISISSSALPFDQQVLAPFLIESNPLTELVNLLKIFKIDQEPINLGVLHSAIVLGTRHPCSTINTSSSASMMHANLQSLKNFHAPEKIMKEEKRKSGSNSVFPNPPVIQ